MKPYIIFCAIALVLSSCTFSEKIVLPMDPVTVVVHQRSSAVIPGTDQGVRIRLGDITGGQVMLSVVTTDERHLIEARSVRPGEVIRILIDGEPLYLKVAKLRNLLFGNDCGEFIISKSTIDLGENPSEDSQSNAPADAD